MYFDNIIIFGLLALQNFLCDAQMDARQQSSVAKYLNLGAESPHELIKIEFSDAMDRRKSRNKKKWPAGTKLKIHAFGKNINLWLHPRDRVLVSESTPVYFSKRSIGSPGNVKIEQQFGYMQRLGKIMEDPNYQASMVIGKDSHGRITVSGEIGSEKVAIRPVPKHIVDKYVRERRSVESLDDDFSETTYHVVYKITDLKEQFSIIPVNKTSSQQRVTREAESSEIPRAIYPKVLVVVENSLVKKLNKNVMKILEYVVVFMNGVDMKYRELGRPRIRFHVAGILIGVEPEGTPYISDFMTSNDEINGGKTMSLGPKFFYAVNSSLPMKNYDVALTLSTLSIYFGSSKILGQSWPATICGSRNATAGMRSFAIVKDNGTFNGVHYAAHEIGHILGMDHDLEQDNCHFKNGFLMSWTPWYTKNSSSFSSCSIKNLQERIDHHELTCLYKKPTTKNGQKFPVLLPGRLKTLEEQCAIIGFGKPCWHPEVDICVNIFCLDEDGECSKTGVAALEGTQCNDENEIFERFCIHNRCVSL